MKRTFLMVLCLFVIAGGVCFAQTANLGAFRLTLADNFQWGESYQGFVNNRSLLNGHQIRPGETYTLTIRFTVSRNLEQSLEVVFVDTTERANWWTELTEWETVAENVRAGQEYSATITFRTTVASTGSTIAANALMFDTQGEGTTGRAGGGRLGPVHINFTEFTLVRN
jgi:hypothetical protein